MVLAARRADEGRRTICVLGLKLSAQAVTVTERGGGRDVF
jgi:hypothetical protein